MSGLGDPSNNPEVKRAYRALVLDADGRIISQTPLPVSNDAAALRAVRMLATSGKRAHKVELWDGLRFIEQLRCDSVPVFEKM